MKRCDQRLCAMIFSFFFFDLGFTALSQILTYIELIVHQRWGETGEPGEKPPEHPQAELGFPTWPKWGSNHSDEKPNGLIVNSPIH